MNRLTMVTGSAGLVGSHLVDALRGAQEPYVATYFRPTIDMFDIADKNRWLLLDVLSFEDVLRVIAQHRPSVIVHLAAQSLPTVSWTDPWGTLNTNVQGTINVFEAVRKIRQAENYDPRIVVACSSAEYGASLVPERVPIDEDAPLLPLQPYGVSKVAQDLLAFQYWRGHGIRTIRARIFNTTGPRKQNDVVSDFAGRVARIALNNGAGELKVGNLQTQRAIIDVRDLVSALRLLSEGGQDGEAYNICGDTVYRIGDLIPLFEAAAGIPLKIAQNPDLLRPTDEPIIAGSAKRLKQETGWRQIIPIEVTIRDTLNYEIARLKRLGDSGEG